MGSDGSDHMSGPGRETAAKQRADESSKFNGQAGASDATSRVAPLLRRALRISALVILAYLVVAYAAMPAWWTWRTRSLHPALQQSPTIAHTADGIPGDPLNIAIIGTADELTGAMLAAKWDPADPITLKSALRIAEGVVLRRPYADAPVSSLYVWGRKEDKAFEQPVGHDPRHRHHVRFWRSKEVDPAGRPIWIGSATYDMCVELSHTTGQITHHISPEVDAERDKLLDDLRTTPFLDVFQYLDDFQPKAAGRNGGGDPWRTDRRLAVIRLRSLNVADGAE